MEAARAEPGAMPAVFPGAGEAMTVKEAFDKLVAAGRGKSFSIGLEVWFHEAKHGMSARSTVEWSAYDPRTQEHFYADTLDGAVKAMLGIPKTEDPMAEAEQSITELPKEGRQ